MLDLHRIVNLLDNVQRHLLFSQLFLQGRILGGDLIRHLEFVVGEARP